jgi:hypothetical protein
MVSVFMVSVDVPTEVPVEPPDPLSVICAVLRLREIDLEPYTQIA